MWKQGVVERGGLWHGDRVWVPGLQDGEQNSAKLGHRCPVYYLSFLNLFPHLESKVVYLTGLLGGSNEIVSVLWQDNFLNIS